MSIGQIIIDFIAQHNLVRRDPKDEMVFIWQDQAPDQIEAKINELLIAKEKDRRIYYQSIVYAVCNALDEIDGNHPGTGIVCGTIDTPSNDVEQRMVRLSDNVADLRRALKSAVSQYDSLSESRAIIGEKRGAWLKSDMRKEWANLAGVP